MSGKRDFYKALLDNLSDGVYFVDRDRCITYWNRGAERITGYTREQVIGKRCADGILMHADDAGNILCQTGCPLMGAMTDGEDREVEAYLNHARGYRIPVAICAAPICDGTGTIIGAVETFTDNSKVVTANKRIENLTNEVERDALTGIGNRRYMRAKLGYCLSEFKRNKAPFGVLFIDIDHFKAVNDDYGHDVGDQALKMIANTLRANTRATDFVGRWGGEEFLVIANQVNREQVIAIANKLRTLVASSQLSSPKGIIKLHISLGATLVRSGDGVDSLVRRADTLLYQSKTCGRDRVMFSV